VIRYRFGADDLLRTRFAVSPLIEVVWSAHALADPARHALHRPWIAAARERLAGLDWTLLDLLANGTGYVPDFITPPPATPLADIEGELERVRATPAAQVAREVGRRFAGTTVPEAVRLLLDDPPRGLALLVDLLRAYWERAIEPWWPAIRAALEADIVHRARRLTAGGTIGVFAGLHPRVAWADGVLEVNRPHDQDVDLRGRGLLLVPAAFAWPDVFAMTDEPWQPAVIYTPRGVGALWAPPADLDPAALDALLGRRRAAVLRALAAPATTLDLARRLDASPAGVSEHLAVLRRAGLVRGQRDGRLVRYSRTAAGESLLRAAGGGGRSAGRGAVVPPADL
jgi:DNA-binding transcriptional ArsR family regulator